MRRRWCSSVVIMLAVAMLVPAIPAGAGTAAPGGRIVYVDAFGGSGIYAIAPDGTNRVLLVPGEKVWYPRWAPDGSGIGFLVRRRNFSFRLEMVDDNGENRTTLIGPGELPDGFVIGAFAWSPDGSHLALDLWNVDTGRQRIYVTPSDGSAVGLVARNAGDPDWSSTDRLLAVSNGDLVTMDPDGSDRTTVVDGRQVVGRPRWSADGQRIVFESHVKVPGYPKRADVFTVNADGSALTNVTNSPEIYDWSPAFSPTGTHIVWAPSPPGESFGFADLWWMRTNGRGRTEITSTRRIDEYTPDWADLPV